MEYKSLMDLVVELAYVTPEKSLLERFCQQQIYGPQNTYGESQLFGCCYLLKS